jgi:hypothetical protein
MPQLDRRDLKKILEAMCAVLNQHTLLPANANKDQLIEKVLNTLEKNHCSLDADDLSLQKNPEKANAMRMALMTALVSEATVALTQNNSLRFEYEHLFKPRGPAGMKQMKEEMKLELLKMLTAINAKLEPEKQKSQKELTAFVDKDIDRKSERFMQAPNQDNLAQNNEMANDCLSATLALAVLYGLDVRNTTGRALEVWAIPQGNNNSFVNQNMGAGKSYMSEQNTVDPGQRNESGKEAYTVFNAIGKGSLPLELEENIQKTGALLEDDKSFARTPTPFTNRPTPDKN